MKQATGGIDPSPKMRSGLSDSTGGWVSVVKTRLGVRGFSDLENAWGVNYGQQGWFGGIRLYSGWYFMVGA